MSLNIRQTEQSMPLKTNCRITFEFSATLEFTNSYANKWQGNK